MNVQVRDFFAQSAWIDHEVLRPLSHIRANWELSWDSVARCYITEEDCFADLLNALIEELDACQPTRKYHDNEDRLGEFVRDRLKWPLRKVDNCWVSDQYGVLGSDNYLNMLEKGGLGDVAESNLVHAAAGRIRAAINRGQNHFDEMEESHQHMLAGIISVILYHRNGKEYEVSIKGK